MYVLGLSIFAGGSSACLLKDGVIVCAAAEERFTRKKNDSGFPRKSISFCLDYASISINDVDCVGFYVGDSSDFLSAPSAWVELNADISGNCSFGSCGSVAGVLRDELMYDGSIEYVGYYDAHAYGSFFASGFDDAVFVLVDGVVDKYCTVLGHVDGVSVSFLKGLCSPNSLAVLYSAVTDYLGFSVVGSEYRVMGLSAYGMPIYSDKFDQVISVSFDGSYVIDMSFFVWEKERFAVSRKFVDLFGPGRVDGAPFTQKHKDIAASLQRCVEDVMSGVLRHAYDVGKCDKLCLSGEVALNSLMNGRVFEKLGFRDVFVLPDPGSSGLSFGAAFYVYYSVLRQRRGVGFVSPFLGPEYSSEYIKCFLERDGVKYSVYDSDEKLVRDVARLIYDNKIVGWFQGRMEWGPRALGARSILSSPCDLRMKDVLNVDVKHREDFRPFAPVVCKDDADDYFVIDDVLSSLTGFMLAVCPVREDKKKLIPAVVHVDGSARVQVIERGFNSLYYDLVKEFGKLSGVPVLINTSFNGANEPIVCSPEDAYRCMMTTKFDCVVMGRFLIRRSDNFKNIVDLAKK